jgi:hypothetical protein
MKRDDETLSQLQMMLRVMTKIPELGELWSIPNVLNTAVGNSCHIVRFFYSKDISNPFSVETLRVIIFGRVFPQSKPANGAFWKNPF